MKYLVISLILLLSLFLRVYKLDSVPPGLFGDEVDVGYQAYSLLKTGSDIHGRFLPFYIKSLSEYRAPLYIYSDVPFVALFGLNEWGVRLPAVFWGVISIIGFFLLLKLLFSERVGLIGSFLMAISPWHLQYSRASFEATMLLAFIIFGIYCFIKSTKQVWYLPLAILLFGLTPYIYSTAVLFTPLIFIALLAIYHKTFLNKKIITKNIVPFVLTASVLLICLIPTLVSTYTGEAKERFGVISIFRDSVLLDKVNLARKAEIYFTPSGEKIEVNKVGESLFHNKPLIYGQVFYQNYLQSLSLDFLFGTGDPNFRQSIFEMGELYLFELFTIFVGLGILFSKIDKKTKIIILSWILLAPIPASLTSDGGKHATRLFILLPPLLLVSSLGVEYLMHNFNRKYLKIVSIALLVLALSNGTLYLHRYYYHYPIESWRWWHVGYKEAFQSVFENQDKYNLVIFNNSYEPTLMRYLYYSKYDPGLFQKQFKDDKPVFEIIPGVKGFFLNDKTAFGYLTEESRKEGGFDRFLPGGVLYMASFRDETAGDLRTYPHDKYTVLKTIVNPKDEPLFFVLGGK